MQNTAAMGGRGKWMKEYWWRCMYQRCSRVWRCCFPHRQNWVLYTALYEAAWHLEKGSLKDAIWYLEQQDSMPDFALCVKDAGIRNAERIIIL